MPGIHAGRTAVCRSSQRRGRSSTIGLWKERRQRRPHAGAAIRKTKRNLSFGRSASRIECPLRPDVPDLVRVQHSAGGEVRRGAVLSAPRAHRQPEKSAPACCLSSLATSRSPSATGLGTSPRHRYGPGQFLGEVGQLSGRASLVDAHAEGEVETVVITPERLRDLLMAEAELGERIMRALILRRVALIQSRRRRAAAGRFTNVCRMSCGCKTL